MVHALYEAQRVLKPDGILIDLRPALKHRRAGLGEGAGFQPLGAMREDFTDDRAADRAVAHVLREGLFRRESRVEFDLDRVMDSLDDFREWLDEYDSLRDLPSHEFRVKHEWLYKRLESAMKSAPPGSRITLRGLLTLGVLRKT